MANDLISKSALLEEMRKYVGNQRYLIPEEVWNMVENAPKAYDVDKVIERLRYLQIKSNSSEFDFAIDKAIEVIKIESKE